jgi:hypothetical protein
MNRLAAVTAIRLSGVSICGPPRVAGGLQCRTALGNVSAARRVTVWLMRAGRRGLLLYPALLSLGAGVLGSCVSERAPPLQSSVVGRPVPQETPVPPQAAPRPARKPVPPPPIEDAASATGGGEPLALIEPKPPVVQPTPETPSQPRDPAPVSTSPSATAPIPSQTTELVGLDQPTATRLFGPAAERSEEPPATVWRYKNAICELDLFFYLDLRSGRMRTLHYALRGDAANAARRQDCLRSLAASRGG